jgi:hypothetical protein
MCAIMTICCGFWESFVGYDYRAYLPWETYVSSDQRIGALEISYNQNGLIGIIKCIMNQIMYQHKLVQLH